MVVAEPERRRAIAEAVEENYYVDQGFAPWISGAAALVVVCTREDDYHDRYRQPDSGLFVAELVSGAADMLSTPPADSCRSIQALLRYDAAICRAKPDETSRAREARETG